MGSLSDLTDSWVSPAEPLRRFGNKESLFRKALILRGRELAYTQSAGRANRAQGRRDMLRGGGENMMFAINRRRLRVITEVQRGRS